MELGSGLTNQTDNATAQLLVDVADVFEEVNGILTLRETGEVLTADGTEQNTYIDNNPLGSFKPLHEFIDLSNMLALDTLIVRVYYRVADGGGWLQEDWQQYVGATGGLTNGKVLIAVDLYPCRFGIRVTIEQSVGAFRDFLWKVWVEN